MVSGAPARDVLGVGGGLELGLLERWIAEVSWTGPLPSKGASLLTHVDRPKHLLMLLERGWLGTGVEDLTEAAGGTGAETCGDMRRRTSKIGRRGLPAASSEAFPHSRSLGQHTQWPLQWTHPYGFTLLPS